MPAFLSKGVDGEVTAYVYDDANCLTSAGGVEYTWDGNGNLLDDGLRTYEYDYANRLIEVVSGAFTTTFTYNGDGHRVAKGENGVTTSYVVAILGLSQVLVETTGGQTTRYVYGHDLLAEYDGSAWAWHLNDGLGSVGQLADESGTIVLVQSYTPFGVPLWSQGSVETGYGFTGEQWETYAELVFLRARYYQPKAGRFLTRDPWMGDHNMPQTLLRNYAYAANNPVNVVDHTGWYGHKEVHHGKTLKWALEIGNAFAGVLKPEPVAHAIAQADLSTDTDPLLTSIGPCIACHFCDERRTGEHMSEAVNSCNPYFFGYILHQAQDLYSHWNEGYEWQHVSDTIGPRSQPLLDDFFEGGHIEHPRGYKVWVKSRFDPHPREQVKANLVHRNPGLGVSSLSDEDLIDLYLRDDSGADSNLQEMRDYFGFNTDKNVEGSRRERAMEASTRQYIRAFMIHITLSCCAVEWDHDISVTLSARGVMNQ